MKVRLLLALLVFALAATSAQAGWRCGPGWGGGPRFYGGYGWGGSFYGPGIGLAVAAPVVVVRPRPVYYYAEPVSVPRRVVYVESSAGQAALVRTQAQLARLGYYRGAVDGDFGPLTSSALRRYQADNGLPITGRLDRATLATLGT